MQSSRRENQSCEEGSLGEEELLSKTKTISDVVQVEEKGCLTFSRVCVNLGKVLNTETRREEYYCVHNWPEDCSKFGCPKLMDMRDPSELQLRTIKRRRVE